MTQLILPSDAAPLLRAREQVAAAAIALGATDLGGPLSPDEQRILQTVSSNGVDPSKLREEILAGVDPLGDALCAVTDLDSRRNSGMFYTPASIVREMVDTVLRSSPSRFVDPGCGSGRFSAHAVRRSPNVGIVAIDADPIATLVCRAVLRTLGARQATVLNADYGSVTLPAITGRTAFVGNPPYVRHHRLSADDKRHAKKLAASFGLAISGLAGLQIHFFLKSFAIAKKGDIGCFITSAEWMDVAYGSGLRSLLMDGLGLVALQLFGRDAWPFEDAMTTAVITSFEVGRKSQKIRVSHWKSMPQQIDRGLFEDAKRWSQIVAGPDMPRADIPSDMVRLGDIVKVSRGVATGSNSYFVMAKTRARSLGIEKYAFPVLHKAQQVLRSGGCVRASDTEAVLLDPAADTNLQDPDHATLAAYLLTGARAGVSETYLASHRRPWWKVGSKTPPIVATYMARQPPAFALNPDGLRILNVIHGFYPRGLLSKRQLRGLVAYLNANRSSFRGLGRTYQGGLEKFEPSEMEALFVPHPSRLTEVASG